MIGELANISFSQRRLNLIYKCGCCGTSFAILGCNEKFCHNCGEKVEWEFMPQGINKTFEDLGIATFEDSKKLCEKLNIRIKNKEYTDKLLEVV